MKILFANEYFVPFSPGGAEWSMYYWAKELAKANHEIFIVTPNLSKDNHQTNYESDGELTSTAKVTVTRFLFHKTGFMPPRVFPSRVFGNPFFTKYFAGQIARIAHEVRAQILVSHGFDSMLPVYFAGNELGIPAVVTVRDYRPICPISICLHKRDYAPARCTMGDFYQCLGEYNQDYNFHPGSYGRFRLYVRRYLEWQNRGKVAQALPGFDAGIFVSDGIRNIYKRSRLLPRRTNVIYNLSPDYDFTKKGEAIFDRMGIDGNKTLLFIGRFSIGKGAQVIHNALTVIRRAVPDVRLVVAGNKEYDVKDDSVIYLGHLQRNELFDCIEKSRAIVLPSRWPEPFSRVLLEALMFAKPVIATCAGGNPEGVDDGETGFLVERNNPKKFAQACIQMLKMPDAEYSLMQKKARMKFEEKFSEKKSIRRMENFLREVVDK